MGDYLSRIDGNTGEVLLSVEVGSNDKVNVRTPKQQENDKNFPLVVKKKVKGGFVKKMEQSAEARKMLLKQPSTFMALNVMTEHLAINTNFVIMEGGRRFKVNDLAEEMEISRQSASRHIAKLKELNLIAEYKKDENSYYVVNPEYYFNGGKCSDKIKELFKGRQV